MDTSSNTVTSHSQESSEDIEATTEIFRAISDHYTNQNGAEQHHDGPQPGNESGDQSVASKLRETYRERHYSSTERSSSSSVHRKQSTRSSIESSVPPTAELRSSPKPGQTPGAMAVYPNNPLRQYRHGGLEISGTTVASRGSPSSPTTADASPLVQARLVRDSEIMFGVNHYHHRNDDLDTESRQATHAHYTDSSHGNNDGNITEAVKVVNEDEILGRRKHFLSLLRDWRIITVMVVLVIAIVGLVVGMTTVKDEWDDELGYSPNSTLFLNPDTIAENEAIANGLVAEIEAVNGADTFSPGTVQRLALDWLVNENILRGMEDFRIIQRFVLASLFFSTGGFSSWVNNTGWISSAHECTWYQNHYSVDSNDRSVVPCDDEGNIQALVLDSNGLDGTLPGGLALLSNLDYLSLSFNSLNGTLPETLVPALLFDIRNTDITGMIPSSVCDTSAQILVNCLNVVCSCCDCG
jgi:hypothetical protein